MAAAGAAAGAAAIAQAIKASGVLVSLDPAEFSKILCRAKDPVVVTAEGGLFGTNHQYLISYKGLAFFTKADQPIPLPAGTELVTAQKIRIPG